MYIIRRCEMSMFKPTHLILVMMEILLLILRAKEVPENVCSNSRNICQQLASGSREYEYKLTMKGERIEIGAKPITDGRHEGRIPQGIL